MAKIGRNDPCFCGSGKKFKKCHGASAQATADSERRFSRIQDHKRQGQTLVPPFLQIPNLQPMSWINDRLPELLWAALLVTHLPRAHALAHFRDAASFIHSLAEPERFSDITHSGLATLPTGKLESFLRIVVSTPASAVALSSLCLLEQLPAGDTWQKILSGAPSRLGWEGLQTALARTLFHQTEEATDCRWLRVLAAAVGGKLVFPSNAPGVADEILQYPEAGDLRRVRPSIRAMEGTFAAHPENATDWPANFWQQCMKDTGCFPLSSSYEKERIEPGTTDDRIRELQRELVKHCNETRLTTDIDSRHDTVFGAALYCVGILYELLRPGVGASVIARSAIRTLTESCITLAYLLSKDSPELWKSFRAYSAGQAKLSLLKIEASKDKPSSIAPETLSSLANEDAWQELVPIDLGHWDKSDLRKMSEEAGKKDVYDKFYGWTSTYSHGYWAAVRDVAFDTCGNPLHRLHRIPRIETRTLPDVVKDACALVDQILDLVSKAYPEFKLRTSL
jgi:hypothetical protein